MPEGTVNAIGLVVNYLLDNGLCNDAERAYLEAVKKLHDSTAGVGLGIDCADGPFGPLTIIGGKMSMVDGRMVQTMDSRYPTCTDGDTIAKQIRAAIGTGAELTDVGSAKPFYIEADTPPSRPASTPTHRRERNALHHGRRRFPMLSGPNAIWCCPVRRPDARGGRSHRQTAP